MSIFRLCTCGVLWLCLSIMCSSPARAELSVAVTGISFLSGTNISEAEKSAFEDALYKAYLDTALKSVPGGYSTELVRRLKEFMASRGNQDVIQYKITSRSQQESMLILAMDFRLNDLPLREWLQKNALTVPLGMRPRILLAITSRGIAPSERYEWWTSSTPKGYSPFERQLAARLADAGENVVAPPQRIPVPPPGPDSALMLGVSGRADLVIAGMLTQRSSDATTVESRLDLYVVDTKTRQRLVSTGVTLKGNVDGRTMNELLISAVIDRIRSEIVKKVVIVSPTFHEKTLCIENISNNDTYQSILAAVRSMDSVSKVTVSRVQGHTICHSIQVKGALQDIMASLRQKDVVPADMAIDGDTAYFRILTQ